MATPSNRPGRHSPSSIDARRLSVAVEANPLDLGAARALYQALGDSGDEQGQRQLARPRRLFMKATPQVIPPEPWFLEAPVASGVSGEGSATEPLTVVWE